MTWNQISKSAVLGLAVLVATSAFAGTNKGTIHLSQTSQINGQSVPAGEYQVRWEGTGSNVEVSVMQGKKVVAKAPAQVIELKEAFGNDATVVDRSSGSAPTVKEVRFANKKYALTLGTEKAEMGESSSK